MKYHKQQTSFSCGASAFRNCIMSFGLYLQEATIRKLLKTNRDDGTDKSNIIEGADYYGLNPKEYLITKETTFSRTIREVFKRGGNIISLTDGNLHYIAILLYKNRKYHVIDSELKPFSQWITFRKLVNLCLCYDKDRNRKGFNFIALRK